MSNEAGFSQEESLEIIHSMINKAKNRFSENGYLYLWWGWTVLGCALAQFILLHYVHYPHHYIVWMLTWAMVILQIFYLRRRERTKKVRTYTDDILGYVWIAFIVLMFLFAFLFGRIMGEEYYKFINPGFLALYGMPTFLSGAILEFAPLKRGGIACWVLSIGAAFASYDYQILMLALGVIAAWIIPGYYLRARYKKENA